VACQQTSQEKMNLNVVCDVIPMLQLAEEPLFRGYDGGMRRISPPTWHKNQNKIFWSLSALLLGVFSTGTVGPSSAAKLGHLESRHINHNDDF
jgi:hypothetical protein